MSWFLVLTFENAFLRVFILKPTERAQFLLKNGTRDFQNSPPFERSACFYVTISESFKRFQYLTLKQIFWKTKPFFKKLEYRFLVETIKIENTSFLFKSAPSEANVQTNRIPTTKWTYHKGWSFAILYLFLKICSSFRISSKRVNLMYQTSQMSIFVFFANVGV